MIGQAAQRSAPPGRSAQPSEPAQSSAPRAAVVAEAPLTKADVQGMIQAALAQQFPAKTLTSKVCSTCGVSKERGSFSATNWNKSEAECLACKPVNPALQKRALQGKICAKCNVEKDRSLFSKSQWQAGSASKCLQCVAEATHSQKKRSKVCITCKTVPWYPRTEILIIHSNYIFGGPRVILLSGHSSGECYIYYVVCI